MEERDIVGSIQKLQQLPAGLHLLCPRDSDDDQRLFYDEDTGSKTGAEPQGDADAARRKCVSDAKARIQLLVTGMVIFAFDGPTAKDLQDWLKVRLEKQLKICDICVREYYRAKKELTIKLNEEYEEEQVSVFCNFFDEVDIKRIRHGLEQARQNLLDTAPGDRGLSAVSREGMYAIFEALNCEVFLHNERLLEDVFDQPFQLIQTKRRLRLGGYVPAMTLFLFSHSELRRSWAVASWLKTKRHITATEFEWDVQQPLKEAMERVSPGAFEIGFLPRFWYALLLVVNNMDKDIITQCLDKKIFTLALENLHVESDAFSTILEVLNRLLTTSPNDFWEAMGAIPAASIVEQVFNNKTLEQVMLRATNDDADDSRLLDSSLAWTGPFMSSINVNNQYPACRALASQFLGRFQQDRYSREARRRCYEMGIHFMLSLLHGLIEANSTPGAINSVTIYDVLGLIQQHLPKILMEAEIAGAGKEPSDLAQATLDIVQLTLKLDILALEADRYTLGKGKSLQHEPSNACESIWRQIIQANKHRNAALASSTLQGARTLSGLEKIVVHDGKTLSIDQRRFNEDLDRRSLWLSDALEVINELSQENMEQLLSVQESANGVLAPLFGSEIDLQRAGIDLLKSATQQTGRKEALGSLLQSFYSTGLTALTLSLRRVARNKIFAPMNNVLKISTDLLEKMCDPGEGRLRSVDLCDEDKSITEGFWQSLWQTLIVIFDYTEDWSNTKSRSKEVMQDFCRETMQFADFAYDQYAIIAGAISPTESKSTPEERSLLRKRLLEPPKATMMSMVRWLRLRDEYLIEKSVSLISKLLKRYKEVGIKLPQDPLLFVEDVIHGKTRTNLTGNQKAELLRALEPHLDHSVSQPREVPRIEKTILTSSGQRIKPEPGGRTQKIDLDKWQAHSKIAGEVKRETDGGDGLDKLLSESSKTAQMLKARGGLNGQVKSAPKKPTPIANKTDPNEFKKKRQAELEAKRKRDAAIIAAAKKNTAPGKVTPMPAEKGSGMMVSSDESSEDEEGEAMDEELFGITRKSKPTAALTTYEEAKQKALAKEKARGPVKKQRFARSARDMRARLEPDLSPLHKILLSWDFFHEGDFPPNPDRDDYSMVASSFRSPADYKNTFQPLLTLEAWQGFVRAREEENPKPFEVKIINRSSVDAFSEVSTSMTHHENKEISISEGDIVLFSKARRPTTSPDEPHCLARVARITRKKENLEVLYRVMPTQPLVSNLAPNSTVLGAKILSLIPLEREYGALTGLEYYDLCQEIVQAKPSPLLDYSNKALESIISNYKVNKAQAKAVKSALDNDAFTLIQGPPGSGKTKTIVGIVGALLTGSIHAKSTALPQPKQQMNHNGFPINNAGPAPKKMLVCAPSNAAVDELVMRFKEGIKTMDGQFRKISVVRLGRSDAMNANVIDVTLDELVNQRLAAGTGDVGNSREETGKIMREHQQVSEQLREVRAQLDSYEAKGEKVPSEIKDRFETIRRQKNALSSRVDSARDNESKVFREADVNRKRAQQAVLDESHVLCATLSGSGHEMFRNLNVEFETVVVDEAAQCVEMSALIPLKYGCAKCILVGDPKQLPPTVFSKEAARFQYEQSLFARMANNAPEDVHLLDVQYRMHPEISAFPSATFYDGRLLDGENMTGLRRRPWHADALLGPYRFFDVQGQHQTSSKGHSLINAAEVEVAMRLYEQVTSRYASKYKLDGKIGIITPYKSQLRELRDRFSRQYGADIKERVEFNTTDAFQGRESEIIIFSCVRASPAGGIGFLQDIRRMNVGLTRAKSSLWVLGNSQSLVRGQFWRKLVDDARMRGRYSEGDLTGLLRESARTASERNMDYAAPDRQLPAANDKNGKKGSPMPKIEPKPEPDMDMEMEDDDSGGDDSLFGTSRSATPANPVIKDEVKTEAGAEDVEMQDAEDSDDGSRSRTLSRSATPANAPSGGIKRPAGAVPDKIIKKHRTKKRNPLLMGTRH